MTAICMLPLAESPSILMMSSFVHRPGMAERFRLADCWAVHWYDFPGEMWLDGQPLQLRPGAVGLTPQGATTRYDWTQPSRMLFAHFRIAPGARAWIGEAPLMTYPEDPRRFGADWADAIAWWPTQPRRAEARLWDLLWRLTTGTVADGLGLVDRARSRIEATLAQPITAADLARWLGCTPEHLSRRFREELDETVLTYVRRRRAEQARHLLQASELSPLAIGTMVGLANAQRLNKTLREVFGVGPKALRASAKGPHARC